MPKIRRDYKLYLLDIASSCRKIIRYTRNIDHNEFAGNSMMIDAVIRNLEIIGEAVNKIPSEIRGNLAEIPWDEIIGLRNKVIHEYFDVNIPIIWETATKDIPIFQKQVRNAIKTLGSRQLRLKRAQT